MECIKPGCLAGHTCYMALAQATARITEDFGLKYFRVCQSPMPREIKIPWITSRLCGLF